jgi:hypothetical protein
MVSSHRAPCASGPRAVPQPPSPPADLSPAPSINALDPARSVTPSGCPPLAVLLPLRSQPSRRLNQPPSQPDAPSASRLPTSHPPTSRPSARCPPNQPPSRPAALAIQSPSHPPVHQCADPTATGHPARPPNQPTCRPAASPFSHCLPPGPPSIAHPARAFIVNQPSTQQAVLSEPSCNHRCQPASSGQPSFPPFAVPSQFPLMRLIEPPLSHPGPCAQPAALPTRCPSPPDAPLNQIPSVRCPQPAALSIRPPSPPVPINRPIQPAEPVHSATHPQPFQPSLSSTTRSDSLSHPITRPPTNGPFPSGPSPTSRSSRRSAVSTFALPTSGPSTSGPPGGCPSIQLALSQLTPTPLPQQCHSVESHLAAPPSTVPPIPVQSVPLLFGFLVMAGFVHRVGSR